MTVIKNNIKEKPSGDSFFESIADSLATLKMDNTYSVAQLRLFLKHSLSGRHNLCAGITFCYIFITLVMILIAAMTFVSPVICAVVSIIDLTLILPIFYDGYKIFTLRTSRNIPSGRQCLYSAFSKKYISYVAANISKFIISLLGTLLLIFPGVMLFYRYRLTTYIIYDEEASCAKALVKSKILMSGNRKKLFMLDLRAFFIVLLSIIPLCIPLFWTLPRIYVTYAHFYKFTIKQTSNDPIFQSLPACNSHDLK